MRIERDAAVWTLAWSPPSVKGSGESTMVVGDWNQTLSFYSVTGRQVRFFFLRSLLGADLLYSSRFFFELG